MAGKIHLPESASGAPEQNAGVNPGGTRGRREMTQGMVGLTKFIQGSLFLLAVGTGVEFGGHHCAQNSALEDPSIFAEPEVFFSSAKPDVNARIE
jgi:hypothetical protein